MKTIKITIPKNVSKIRVNNAVSVLENYCANVSFDGQHITYDINKDTPDYRICELGLLIGVTLCKIF